MIVIPKLRMPKNCEECPCVYDGYCSAMYCLTGKTTSIPGYYKPNNKRPDFCPLIEKKPGIRILKDKTKGEKEGEHAKGSADN